MFGKGDVEGVFLSKRDVGRLQTAGVAWAIEERGDHRVLSEASGTCVFLDPRTKGCGIYDVRPTQCRNFPFTPGKDSPIATRSQWNTAREHCPGIGIGRYYDKRHIRKLALIAKSSKHENAKQPHWAQARSSCWGTRSPPL